MSEAYICDYIRTPIGRFGGALSSVRADDLAAIPLKALMARHGEPDARRLGIHRHPRPRCRFNRAVLAFRVVETDGAAPRRTAPHFDRTVGISRKAQAQA